MKRFKRELANTPFEEQFPLLMRINALLGERDVGLLLTLCLRRFHIGDDALAFEFLNKARRLDSDQHDVLRVGVFLAAATGDPLGKELCAHILEKYPSDEWAIEMKEKLQEGKTNSLDLPAIYENWSAQ